MLQAAQPLGRLLVASGLLTQQALDEVLHLQKTDGRRLGELLAEKGLVRPHQLAQFLSHQLACPWVSLQRVEVTREAVEILPRDIALKHHMVPVHLRTSKGATALYVAMDDPTDDVALSEATVAATMPVKPMVALTSEIRALLDRLYGGGTNAGSVAPRGVPSGAPPPRSPSFASIPVNVSITEATPTPPAAAVQAPATPRPGATSPSARPPKPPPPKASAPPPRDAAVREARDTREDPSILDEIDILEDGPTSLPVRPSQAAKVLLVDASEPFVVSVRAAAAKLGGDVVAVSLAEAEKAIADYAPCALIVTEAVYSNERSGLDRMALEVGAVLIVSNEQFEGREGLLEGAIKRWRQSSYEKGTILEGRYELLRDLGGRVAGSRWEVRHLRTARRSMLKVGVRAAHDETDADAVRREQQALARVHHPGALDLRDAGNTELGDPYIVVEMAEGRTLEGLVAARGALDPKEACALIRQVADVLVAAHDAGVRHCEVRPENILIVRDAWGVERAKLVHWESASVSDGVPDTAIDLAGIGACAFLALAGRTRNPGEDTITTSSSWPKAFAPELAAVIARAIGRGPGGASDRFTSAKHFVDALEAASPRRRDSMAFLAANPERRASHRPASLDEMAAQQAATSDDAKSDASSEPAPAPKVEELRRFPRAPYRTPVRVEVSGVGAVDGRSEDISEGGLFVVTRGKIPDGAQVTVRFALPIDGKVVSEAGVVKWSRSPQSGEGGDPRAIGIELTSAGAESVKQIARYVSFMAIDK